MKLILFPLIILITLAMLPMMGLGTGSTFGNHNLYDPKKTYDSSGAVIEMWYDVNGHAVAFANLTLTDATEGGYFILTGGGGSYGPYRYVNATSTYYIYDRNDATMSTSVFQGGFNIGTTLGVIAIIGAVMAIGIIAGINVFGSGLSDVSVKTLITSSLFVTIWLIFSAISLSFINQIPVLGYPFYFFLTIMYTIGVASKISGEGGED